MIFCVFSVWVNSDGYRYVPELWSNSDKRNLNINYFDNRWNRDYRFLAVCNSLCFSTFFKGGFHFNDLIHPPNIFPISFNLSESFIYFLLSKDFISHEICRKNLSRSNFTEAFLSEINFSNLSEILAFIIPSITSKNKESIFAPRVYFESFGKSGRYSCHNL